jgi:hypothetical protein
MAGEIVASIICVIQKLSEIKYQLKDDFIITKELIDRCEKIEPFLCNDGSASDRSESIEMVLTKTVSDIPVSDLESFSELLKEFKTFVISTLHDSSTSCTCFQFFKVDKKIVEDIKVL